MDLDQLRQQPRIRVALRRAHLWTARSLLCSSGSGLLRSGLTRSEVQQLLLAAAAASRRHPPTSALLCGSGLSLSVGCPVLDELLGGGLPVGGVTELSGESGVGKTQLALQLSLSVQYPTEYGGLGSGAVFICTEDSFPIKRLQQLVSGQSTLRPDVPPDLIHTLSFSDHVYVEHAADLDALQVCLTRRVPLLLARGLVRLLVLDSVAALFRVEFQASDWLERSQQLISLSSTLHHLSHEFNTPVLCINQVTDVFHCEDTLGPLSQDVAPALGLAWANQVTVRLMMRRLPGSVASGDQHSVLRRLEVVFAPHLAREGRDVVVWREGVRGRS